MVLQEDAILHSEDVRNHFFYYLGFIHVICVAQENWNVLFLCCCCCFNAEFKENGHNNNTPSVPVSILSADLLLQNHYPQAAACCRGASAHFPVEAGVGSTGGVGQGWVPPGKAT